MAALPHYPRVTNEARRQLIGRMSETFKRESLAHVEEIVDWMIDNEWVSDEYYRAIAEEMS